MFFPWTLVLVLPFPLGSGPRTPLEALVSRVNYFPTPYMPPSYCHCHCHCPLATCLSGNGLYITVWPLYLYKLAAQEIGLFKFRKFYPISSQGLSFKFPRHYHNVSVLESLGSCPGFTITVACHVPYVMCIAVPVGHLVVLFAVMIRARVHSNDQEFIPSMLISELSLRTVQ